MPELAVIAAGSLLDLTLAETDFPMPVGRVEYLFMGPMTFGEFLLALGRENFKQYLDDYRLGDVVPRSFHDELMGLVRTYVIIGGMPAVVANSVPTVASCPLKSKPANREASSRCINSSGKKASPWRYASMPMCPVSPR